MPNLPGNKNSSDAGGEPGTRPTVDEIIVTTAPGSVTYGNGVTTIDASNTSEGYIMVNYTGASDKVQIQITNPDGSIYPYPLGLGDFRAFPLTFGNGTYTVSVLECVTGDMYAMNFSQAIDVAISDEFKPYLYPNQYVDYNASSNVVSLGKELSGKAYDDISFVGQVYDYVISNITYDNAFAANAPTNYIPNPDNTLSTKTGICFDYASAMSSMLRSQGIPTKLVVGYSGQVYHAWISVYLKEQGWVDNIIEFDGTNWSLMDPTLAANNSSSAVAQYIGDGSNYTAKYMY